MKGVIKAKEPENAMQKLLQKLNQELGTPSNVEYDIELNKEPVSNISDINILPKDKLNVNINYNGKLIKSNFVQNNKLLIGKYEIIR